MVLVRVFSDLDDLYLVNTWDTCCKEVKLRASSRPSRLQDMKDSLTQYGNHKELLIYQNVFNFSIFLDTCTARGKELLTKIYLILISNLGEIGTFPAFLKK